MKKLFFIAFFFISIASYAQPNLVFAKTLQATEKLTVINRSVTGLSNDTTFSSMSINNLITEYAIKTLIKNSKDSIGGAFESKITASNTIKKYWNGYKNFVTLNSDSLNEGSTNLFFTNLKARSALSLTTVGTSGVATYNNSTGVFNIPNYSTDTSSLSSRINLKADKATTLSVTSPITGGGDLSANRSFGLDTSTASGGWHSKNYYDTKYKSLIGVVGGGGADDPVAGLNTFTSSKLVGLNDQMTIVVAGIMLRNYGNNPYFTFTSSTGTINLGSNKWTINTSILINLNQ